MRRMVGVWILGVCMALPLIAEGKEHGGQEHGGATLTETKPPGLAQQGSAPTGLKKQDRTPSGRSHGKKKGLKKSTPRSRKK